MAIRNVPRSVPPLLVCLALALPGIGLSQATHSCNWGNDVTNTTSGTGSWGSGCSWRFPSRRCSVDRQESRTTP